MVVRGKAFAASIDFLGVERSLDPLDKMLDQALVQLVKDVGRDGGVDVTVWEIFPIRVGDWLDSCVATPCSKVVGVGIIQFECI